MAELPVETRLASSRDRRIISLRSFLITAGALLLVVVPLLGQVASDPFYVRFVTRVMAMAIAAVSLDLILGFGGMACFGQAAFLGVGAYVTAILSWHVDNADLLLSWPVAIPGSDNAYVVWPVAILAAALAALVIGLVSLRTSGAYFIMITLAFAQMLYFFFVSLQRYGGDDGLQMAERSYLAPLDLGNQTTFYYVVFCALVLCLLLSHRLVHSRFGMVLRGCRQNERRLRAIGFPTFRYKLVAFVVAGAMAGLSGVLLANNQSFVSPADLAWTRSGELMIMVVLGGMGTLYGPVIGAAVYFLLQLVLGSYTVHWQVILGPILILVVLFAKRGLWGLAIRSGRYG